MFSNLKLWVRWLRVELRIGIGGVVGGGHGLAPVSRGGNDRLAWGRGGGDWPARHGTSIRWASLLAWMFGHVHSTMCSGGCQFEVLEEHVRT